MQLALHNSEHIHSFHEVSILIALALFEQHEVEWAAMETGVGGRFDQTRALDVAATVLTNVGSDHAHMLGREKWQRTLDKAGIARPGVPFFTTEIDPESLEIIAAVCGDAGAPLRVIGRREVVGRSKNDCTYTTATNSPRNRCSAPNISAGTRRSALRWSRNFFQTWTRAAYWRRS
ncbi:MAG: hypothetical protein HC802_14735 [Caldilineaceae bacterium]|nr:hypothetical protein [Caldilineaceae bacterium]